MYKSKAFAELTNATCPLLYFVLFFPFFSPPFLFYPLNGGHSPRNYFTAPSLCNIFFPLESSPFFFLEEYMSSGALIGLLGPMMPRPETGMCGRTVGEAALLGGPDFSIGT